MYSINAVILTENVGVRWSNPPLLLFSSPPVKNKPSDLACSWPGEEGEGDEECDI